MSVLAEWKRVLELTLGKERFEDRERRTCREKQNLVFTLKEDDDPYDPARMIREMGWYYPSDEELASIMLQEEHAHRYSYSEAIARQLPRLVHLLRRQPRTRRAILQFSDYQNIDLDSEHVPSFVTAWLTIHDQTLQVMVHARSIDLFMGLPANLVHVRTLQEAIAAQLGVDCGRITLVINSGHVFEEDEKHILSLLKD